MAAKTNAIRLVEQAKIPVREAFYEFDEHDLGGVHAAQAIGMPPEQVFKTLVLRGDKHGIFVCVIPGDKEVDLKKAAKMSGNKSAEMIAMKELLPTTGYIRGGCSPIGMKKNFPVYIQESCLSHDYIYISAGQRGLQIKIAPADLIGFVSAQVGDMID